MKMPETLQVRTMLRVLNEQIIESRKLAEAADFSERSIWLNIAERLEAVANTLNIMDEEEDRPICWKDERG